MIKTRSGFTFMKIGDYSLVFPSHFEHPIRWVYMADIVAHVSGGICTFQKCRYEPTREKVEICLVDLCYKYDATLAFPLPYNFCNIRNIDPLRFVKNDCLHIHIDDILPDSLEAHITHHWELYTGIE